MPDYSRGKIYKIVCNETGLIYVGSTCEPTLARRLAKHVRNFKAWKKDKSHFVTSFKIIENSNYDIVLLESCPCESKDELHKRERHYIETVECVNKCVVGRTREEYYEENREIIIKKQKEYYQENKVQFVGKNKDYHEMNKEKIKARKSKIHICECGRTLQLTEKARHERSKVHQNYIESLKKN